MKLKYSFVLFLICFQLQNVLSQDIEKMNKKELQAYSLELLTQTYTQKDEIERQVKLREALSQRITQMEKQGRETAEEIQQLLKARAELLNQVEALKSQNQSLKSQHETTISLLNDQIASLRDSVLSYRSLLSVTTSLSPADPNDFLNDYFFKAMPLSNNTFQMVSPKVVFGDIRFQDNYYSNNNSTLQLPEIIDSNAFTYWGVKPNQKVISNTKFNDYVYEQSVAFLNAKLPKIQILNNKFLTIYYPDGSEEAFLFSAKKISEENSNNHRSIIEFNLEGADDDNENADIVWRIFVIESDCYLALSNDQLNRIKVDLRLPSKGLEVYETDGDIRNTSSFESYYKYTTTGNGIYLSRKKDRFMDSSYYSNPEKMVFLIKLK
jgi:hypothetical protein